MIIATQKSASGQDIPALRIPLKIRRPLPSFRPLVLYQTICLPSGQVKQPCIAVLVQRSRPIAEAELKPLAYWPDGSLRWCRILSLISISLDDLEDLELQIPGDAELVPEMSNIVRHEAAGNVNISTGFAEFLIDTRHASPLRAVRLSTDGPSAGSGFRTLWTDLAGRSHTPEVEECRIKSEGNLNTHIHLRLKFLDVPALQVTVDMLLFAGTGLLDATVTVRNGNCAKHKGGLWDLGDAGSISFRDFSIEFDLAEDPNATTHLKLQDDSGFEGRVERNFILQQASSGGKNWNSQNHVNASGTVPCPFRGYRLDSGQLTKTGDRASPTMIDISRAGIVALNLPYFWQNFPKVLQFRDSTLRIGLFPHEYGDPFELQGGEQKTHRFRLLFAPQTGSVESITAQVREPYLEGQQPSDWVCAHGLPCDGTSVSLRDRPRLDALLMEALDGPHSIYANREEIDEYGWRHFGEIVADHEKANYTGPLPLVSHYNNQFDVIHGFLLNYLRTGEERLFDLADELACHVSNIDIYHTTKDRWAFNGGLFWHTDHYRHAHTATHRAYSRWNAPKGTDYGGGPACEHNFTTGLSLHYCLTGSAQSKAAVMSLADWVLNMEDGAKGRFRIIDSSPTGLSTLTATEGYHGPGRGAGNSINALLDGWWLSRSDHYLCFAEQLVRRCIHPDDDIEKLDLLNIELRWSYTVFLTSLSKYLATKLLCNALDENFEYARRSLVHYARWMAEFEIPYFDQQEQMQYPTETWAAQDLRKANVLRSAAQYVEDPMKSTLFEKGELIAERAWSDLERFNTKAFARPLAIMMVEGLKEKDIPSMTIEVPSHLQALTFGPSVPFVAQKQRVLRMLRSPIAALAGMSHALAYLVRPRSASERR